MEIIVDSALTFEEAVAGTDAPQEIIDALELVAVDYRSFDEKLHRGQLLVHRSVARETREIFAELLSLSFPILKVIPIVRYGWDDSLSMEDNNSSAFNSRGWDWGGFWSRKDWQHFAKSPRNN